MEIASPKVKSILNSGVLTSIAKAAFLVTSRMAGFTAFGLVLNLIFVVILLSERNGAIPYSNTILPTVAALTFFMLFPVTYYFLAKKHGVSLGVNSLIKTHKEHLVVFIIGKLFEYVGNRAEVASRVDQYNNHPTRQLVNQHLPEYLEKLDNMPWIVRAMVKHLLSKVDFKGVVRKVMEDKGMQELDIDVVSQAVSQRINDYLDENFFETSLTWFWLLVPVNIIAFAVFNYFLS